MKVPTILDFLTECLRKSGLEVEQYHLSDGSGSGLSIRKENKNGIFLITLQFGPKGIILEDVQVFRIELQEVDQDRIV